VRTFAKALRAVAVAEVEPQILAPARALSTCVPFPWSQSVYEADRTVFNLVACDNTFEATFARFLDGAPDVAAFAKLPMRFAFSIEYLDDAGNLRLYHPDWVGARTRRRSAGTHGAIGGSTNASSRSSRRGTSPIWPPCRDNEASQVMLCDVM
jgi:hypothetical protein